MSLKDDLMDVQGVGEARAEEIMAVIDDNGTDSVPDAVQTAYDYLQAGQYGQVESHLERALGED